MALISQRTNLKSLRYGQDRPGGGDSGQPYIQSSVSGKLIDVNIGNLNVSIPFPNLGILGRGTGGEDFLLRGGTQTPSRALKDVSRLTKMFFDVKSPKGVLFSIKQNLLSLSGVKTQGSGNINLNEGIYLPTSTIAQAAGNAFGFHLNKQGTNPFRNTSPNSGGIFPIISSPLLDIFGIPAYAQRVKSDQIEAENRLVQLKNAKIISNLSSFPTDEELREERQRERIIDRRVRQNERGERRAETQRAQNAGTLDQLRAERKAERDRIQQANRNARPAKRQARKDARINARNQVQLNIPQNPRQILQYSGGPGSILGFGQTTIKRYSNTNEGVERASEALIDARSPFGKTPLSNALINFIGGGANTGITPSLFSFPSLTSQFGLPFLKNDQSLFPYLVTNTNEGLDFNRVGNNYTLFDLKNTFEGRYYVLDSSAIRNQPSSKDTTLPIQDFRTLLLPQQAKGFKKNILATAPDYNEKQIEQRVNLGDPGKRNKNTISYNIGLLDENKKAYGALDKITAMPLYKLDKANHSGERNDLVKFSIGIIDNNAPDQRVYIHFRAFLDSMDDNYTAEWNDFRYMGRGEKFYRYNGFTRTVNLGWTVAAQSKEELIPMYQKLNFLASSLTPDYSPNGYMRGNLAILTVGGYLFEQPGIINSINYSVPTESPWEIGINDLKGNAFNSDHTVKELPHIIKVTGFSFTPIHQFVPRLQQNTYEGLYADTTSKHFLDKAISKFGSPTDNTVKERYIALSRDTTPTGDTTNYNPPNDYTWSTAAIKHREDRVTDLVTQYP